MTEILVLVILVFGGFRTTSEPMQRKDCNMQPAAWISFEVGSSDSHVCIGQLGGSLPD